MTGGCSVHRAWPSGSCHSHPPSVIGYNVATKARTWTHACPSAHFTGFSTNVSLCPRTHAGSHVTFSPHGPSGPSGLRPCLRRSLLVMTLAFLRDPGEASCGMSLNFALSDVFLEVTLGLQGLGRKSMGAAPSSWDHPQGTCCPRGLSRDAALAGRAVQLRFLLRTVPLGGHLGSAHTEEGGGLPPGWRSHIHYWEFFHTRGDWEIPLSSAPPPVYLLIQHSFASL